MLSIALAAHTPLSLAQYIAQLTQLQQAVMAASDSHGTMAIAQQLPAQWLIEDDGRIFTVIPNRFRQVLLDYANQPTEAKFAAVKSQLDLLLVNARAMQFAKLNPDMERDKLSEILSRNEFRNVTGQSWYDRWKQAAQRWLAEMLERMVNSSSFPVVSRIIIWGLLAAAVLVAVIWLIRTYRQSNIYTVFTGSPEILPNKPWRDWQTEAQAAAQQGRWRDAIHLSYRAAIAFLEAQGVWRPDPSRTPREYLRLLPAGNSHRDSLQQLTRSFERVWYGTDAATAETFAGASALLERLGCR